MSFPLQITANTVSPGTCYPSTFQGALNAIAQNLFVTGISDLSTFVFGPITPDTDQQSLPWIKTDSQNRVIGLYTFSGGSWQAAAPPILPGTVLDFFGNAGSVAAPYFVCNGQVINGPLSGALTTPNLSGLVTLGTGTNPTTGTNFANQAVGGEELHVLTQPELPNVTLTSTTQAYQSTAGAGLAGGGTVNVGPVSTPLGGQGIGHNTLQPYMALYKIIFWP